MVIKGPLALVFAKVTSPAIVIVAPDAAEIVRVSPLATVKALIVTEEQSERSEASSTLLTEQEARFAFSAGTATAPAATAARTKARRERVCIMRRDQLIEKRE